MKKITLILGILVIQANTFCSSSGNSTTYLAASIATGIGAAGSWFYHSTCNKQIKKLNLPLATNAYFKQLADAQTNTKEKKEQFEAVKQINTINEKIRNEHITEESPKAKRKIHLQNLTQLQQHFYLPTIQAVQSYTQHDEGDDITEEEECECEKIRNSNGFYGRTVCRKIDHIHTDLNNALVSETPKYEQAYTEAHQKSTGLEKEKSKYETKKSLEPKIWWAKAASYTFGALSLLTAAAYLKGKK